MVKVGLGIPVAAVLLAGCSPVYVTHSSGGVLAPTPEVPRARSSDEVRSGPEERRAPAGELSLVLASFVWPLAVDRPTVLSSPYGFRIHPLGRDTRFHGGVDLRAPAGTPVYAAAAGRVARSGVGGAYGNVVVIDHGTELQSLYGHNRDNLVREGDHVRRGQVIALVGRSGNATGDHLHFELRWRGGTVDPLVVLPRLGGGIAR